MGKEQDSPKILYVQGYPVKVKYSGASNCAALKSIQSIILGEAEENQIFAHFPVSLSQGRHWPVWDKYSEYHHQPYAKKCYVYGRHQERPRAV